MVENRFVSSYVMALLNLTVEAVHLLKHAVVSIGKVGLCVANLLTQNPQAAYPKQPI